MADSAGATGNSETLVTAGATGSPDASGATGSSGGTASAGGTAAAERVIPDKYEFKVAEGQVDKAVAEKIAEQAKALKLTADEAQGLYDQVAGARSEAAQAAVKAEIDKFNAVRASWSDAVKADPEIGGANFEASTALARKVVARFANTGLIKLLEETGFGDHPEVVRLLHNVGKVMREDDFILPGSKDTNLAPKDPATVLYGGTTK